MKKASIITDRFEIVRDDAGFIAAVIAKEPGEESAVLLPDDRIHESSILIDLGDRAGLRGRPEAARVGKALAGSVANRLLASGLGGRVEVEYDEGGQSIANSMSYAEPIARQAFLERLVQSYGEGVEAYRASRVDALDRRRRDRDARLADEFARVLASAGIAATE